MATHYLIPDIITKRNVQCSGGAMWNPQIMLLSLFFNRPSTDFNDNDVIYASHNGTSQGLLEPYEYTILGGKTVCPIGEDNLTDPWDPTQSPLTISYENDFITIVRNLQNTFYLNIGTSQFVSSETFTSLRTVGLAIAVFSDGVALWSWITINDNPNLPYYSQLTYLEPTTSSFGYMLVQTTEESGYAPLVLSPGFTFTTVNKTVGRVLYGKSVLQSDDPYDNFPEPTDPGGDGEPDSMGPGDSIDIPTTPAISAADSGFVNLFNPTLAQLKALAQYMWSGPFDLDSFKKIFADPMDCIIGLSIVPVAVPNGGVVQLSVGNISTGIAMSLAAANFVEVNCGSLTVKREFNSYMDYAPYTQVSIYLPYIGFRPLDADNIIPKGGQTSKNIQVVYKVDLFTGACIAFIKCGDSVLYTFCGQCGVQIPVTGQSWTQLYRAIANFVCTAGTNFGAAAGGNMAAGVGGASSALDVAFSGKPQIQRSGALGSAIGMLGVQKPYLVIRRPVPCIPQLETQDHKYTQSEFTGYPSFKLVKMSDLSGYVEITQIHLENIPATENEIDEIESLLKGGVLI